MPYLRRMWRSRGGRRKKYSHFFGESRFLTIFAVTKVVNIGFLCDSFFVELFWLIPLR